LKNLAKYNTTTVVSNYSFGSVSKTDLNEVFKCGRVSSFLLKKELPNIFKKLKLRETSGSNSYVDKDGNIFHLRTFGATGMKFMPSKQIGIGRNYDQSETKKIINNTYLIACDIVDFPTVHIRIFNADHMLQLYPSASVPYLDRYYLFPESNNVTNIVTTKKCA
jgi:hypothetical protein